MEALVFNAKKEFSINANAAIFLAQVGEIREDQCVISPFDGFSRVFPHRFGYVGDYFVADMETYGALHHLEGHCPFTWRQGIRHDAADVMVLEQTSSMTYINGKGEDVNVEDTLLYPFVKGSTIANTRVVEDTTLCLVIPQTTLKQNPAQAMVKSPLLWNYLLAHGEVLSTRKSRMYYRHVPAFPSLVLDRTHSALTRSQWHPSTNRRHSVSWFQCEVNP